MWLWWRRFRNLDRVEVLTDELTTLNRHHAALSDDYKRVCAETSAARDLRLSADVIAAERLRAIERLEKENDRLREVNERILAERLKSLDAINVKLMEPRTETPPADIRQYAEALRQASAERGQDQVRHRMVDETRAMHRAMDTAIIRKYYPSFSKKAAERAPEGPSLNEAGPVTDPIPETA